MFNLRRKYFRFTNKIFVGTDEGDERKHGSMIIKLRKDKKIVNDMFKQEIFRRLGGGGKQNPHIWTSENEWINESINNRIALSLQSDNKVLVWAEKLSKQGRRSWRENGKSLQDIARKLFPSSRVKTAKSWFEDEKLMNI